MVWLQNFAQCSNFVEFGFHLVHVHFHNVLLYMYDVNRNGCMLTYVLVSFMSLHYKQIMICKH